MNYIKSALKVLVDYLVSLLLFGIFLYPFMAMTGDNYSNWLPVYSFLMFLVLAALLYSDIRKKAEIEKKPQNDMNPYPLKGLIYGLLGFAPVILIELVLFLVRLPEATLERAKVLLIKTIIGPTYWIARLFGLSAAGYALAFLIVPVIAALAYAAGFYGFRILRKKSVTGNKAVFKKSPWNPTVKNEDTGKKTRKAPQKK